MNDLTQHSALNTQHWGLIGHAGAIARLQKSLAHGRARHAYLFCGPASVGKTTLALALARMLNCEQADASARPCGECRACRKIAARSHPDVFVVEAESVGGTLKIEQVRDLMHMLALRPYEGRYRIGILRRFHEANPQAADALLKTLEEPPPYVVLMLTTENLNALPATILSRCQPLHLRPVAAAEIEAALIERWNANSERAALLAQLSGGRPGWAVNALTDENALTFRNVALDDLEMLLRQGRVGRFQRAETLAKDKDTLLPTLALWQGFWRDVLLIAAHSHVPPVNRDRRATLNRLASDYGVEAAEIALRATRAALDDLDRNVNARLAVEVMLLDYPGLKRDG